MYRLRQEFVMDQEQCCPTGTDRPVLPRRDFLRLTACATVGMPILAQAGRLVGTVPLDKGTVPSLFDRGTREIYSKHELKYIGMPVGGLCAGQVYLGGDGRLWLWDIFNEMKLGTIPKPVEYEGEKLDPVSGSNYAVPPQQVHPFQQGFAINVDGRTRTFDLNGWDEVSFEGKYPIGVVNYDSTQSPISVSLEAFSPFVPLDADSSSLPAVLMRFTLTNKTDKTQTVEIGGYLENPVGLHSLGAGEAVRVNTPKKYGVEFGLKVPQPEKGAIRPPIRFEDWENGFGDWKVEGEAFGSGPIDKDTLKYLSGPIGGPGKFSVKSFRLEKSPTGVTGDALVGKLISKSFVIERRYVECWVGGGHHPETAAIRLVVEGKTVRSATGNQVDELSLRSFNVSEFQGKTAHFEIVDEETAAWGQIGVGRIEFVDTAASRLEDRADIGEMALACLDHSVQIKQDLGKDPVADLFTKPTSSKVVFADVPVKPASGVTTRLALKPRQSETVTFVVAWRFPNLTLNKIGKVGHFYAERFKSVDSVISHLKQEGERLIAVTQKWVDTWYDSTLPIWFLNRTMANTSTLATMTSVRFANGRFYAWEGVGCCEGTCGHVWQYAQAVGRLFPELERSIREQADYQLGAGYHESGLIDFRGEYGNGFAADAQAGYVLRTYREHQTSVDDKFLRRVYDRMKTALEYLIKQEGGETGILTGSQHNTLDVNLYGPSSWLTSLFLSAVSAGAEMAREVGDTAAASRWSDIFQKGIAKFDEMFWNGSYYIHRLNVKEHFDGMRIGNGCEVDMLMGQSWSHQVGLPRIVSKERATQALKSLYKNNFLPDVGPFRKEHKLGRWYAVPGEGGLLLCSFPFGDEKEILGPEPTWAAKYFNEVWTGTEYQAASHMIAEGLVEEGFRVVKAAHDRHHPAKRNPFNEIECSDHYVRAMASFGVFITTCGFGYHGPKGELTFAPKAQQSNFRAAFTASEGWGSFWQKDENGKFRAGIEVKHGVLRLRKVSLASAGSRELTVKHNGRRVPCVWTNEDGIGFVTFDLGLVMNEGDGVVFESV